MTKSLVDRFNESRKFHLKKIPDFDIVSQIFGNLPFINRYEVYRGDSKTRKMLIFTQYSGGEFLYENAFLRKPKQPTMFYTHSSSEDQGFLTFNDWTRQMSVDDAVKEFLNYCQ